MGNIIEWDIGLNGYKKCTLELGSNTHKFTTELLNVPFNINRSISDIFNDHLSIRQHKLVEVLYSGGLDSELILLHCLRNNIPVIAITMVIRVNGLIINTHDLYYSEKFCRAHNITHTLIDFNADKFFENGDYCKYLKPYYIIEPHIATHFWLLEQCQSFPILGGDWPWVHMDKTDKILSPARLEFSSYERFMADNSITGIGNMIGFSLDSTLKLIQLHMENHVNGLPVSVIKGLMYKKIEPSIEPRLRSYGWENHRTNSFNMVKYKIDLIKSLQPSTCTIKWNTAITDMLQTSINYNDKF
jgi:hypothetical protein